MVFESDNFPYESLHLLNLKLFIAGTLYVHQRLKPWSRMCIYWYKPPIFSIWERIVHVCWELWQCWYSWNPQLLVPLEKFHTCICTTGKYLFWILPIFFFWGGVILIFGTSVLKWVIGDMISCDIKYWCYVMISMISCILWLWCYGIKILLLRTCISGWLLSTKSFIIIHFFIVKMRYIKKLTLLLA